MRNIYHESRPQGRDSNQERQKQRDNHLPTTLGINLEVCTREKSWTMFWYHDSISIQGLRKTIESLSPDSRDLWNTKQ